MNENAPIMVAIIGAVFLGYMVISCAREDVKQRPEIAKYEAGVAHEYISKGYHRNSWGGWVKDKRVEWVKDK
ncbi:MAG: hypothetical protein A2Y38_11335 [Spirochaetes bacterium GWB1_59_5]|nr:MAG: hypothetical protein A2Y38_11335 [Spirochaetes bacterium GWB1_59_5]